jgi:hypothetical protein
MGITIHYSGTFRSDRSLPELIDEAVAFANANNWKFIPLERNFGEETASENTDTQPQFGVLLLPPGSEPVHLCFAANRRLGYFIDLRTVSMETWIPDDGPDGGRWEPDPVPDDYEPTWGAFTKTQYAGALVHLKVVELLRQVSEKYFSDFICNDDSGFWDSRDETKLLERFGEQVF